MGQNFSSEPVVEKDTERDHNDIFNVAVSSCQGWRLSQEDNHSMMLELPGKHKAAFFAVYDGHGSARVSKHASEYLWRHLIETESYQKGDFKEALEKSFLTFDEEVNANLNAQLAGTTAVCVLIVNNVVYCANIGDSRAVACINCVSVPMSYDHKPENPKEFKRILAAGGYVLGNRVNGNLALSRAFGDFHYKNNATLPPDQQIVTPCPDVKKIELNDDVDFLVLACDGIWDVLTNEEVVEFVIGRLEQEMEPGLICEELTTRCLARDYELVIGCDNMTVLLVCYTRGRSWLDYCRDITNKTSSRGYLWSGRVDYTDDWQRREDQEQEINGATTVRSLFEASHDPEPESSFNRNEELSNGNNADSNVETTPDSAEPNTEAENMTNEEAPKAQCGQQNTEDENRSGDGIEEKDETEPNCELSTETGCVDEISQEAQSETECHKPELANDETEQNALEITLTSDQPYDDSMIDDQPPDADESESQANEEPGTHTDNGPEPEAEVVDDAPTDAGETEK